MVQERGRRKFLDGRLRVIVRPDELERDGLDAWTSLGKHDTNLTSHSTCVGRARGTFVGHSASQR